MVRRKPCIGLTSHSQAVYTNGIHLERQSLL